MTAGDTLFVASVTQSSSDTNTTVYSCTRTVPVLNQTFLRAEITVVTYPETRTDEEAPEDADSVDWSIAYSSVRRDGLAQLLG